MLFAPENYSISAYLFCRFLGLIYLFSFGAFFFQIKGLLGKDGILPINEYLAIFEGRLKNKYYHIPTLFWINASDQSLTAVIYVGLVLSLLLIFGIAIPLMLITLYVLYLSVVSVGQAFLGFGWEGFLLETTAHAFFISLSPVPNIMVWLSLNFLVFRFFIQAGAVKLQSHDSAWRNLTAIYYHYQSQPLPNTIAWLIHKAPLAFHKLSCVFMFGVELIVPFGLFFGEVARLIVFFLLFSLQFSIWATGNFSFLNHLTAVLLIVLISNRFLPDIPITAPLSQDNPLLYLAGTFLLFLQIIRFIDHFFPKRALQNILIKFSPFHIANRYGIFAVMTTDRYEIIIEGSEDGKEWKEYLFSYKPTELSRRPRRISPYQPRLDWQAWFLPFHRWDEEEWYSLFLSHLLKGTPEVLKLIRYNPFQASPPRYVRAMTYLYEFTSFKEKRETGNWWKRRLVGSYSPVMEMSLKPNS